MTLTNEIIAEMVSYIDLADIKEFALNHPELVEKENKDIFIGSFLINTIIRKITSIECIKIQNEKGSDKNG